MVYNPIFSEGLTQNWLFDEKQYSQTTTRTQLLTEKKTLNKQKLKSETLDLCREHGDGDLVQA